jgi:microcystin degradation protein MlrC
MVTQQDQYLTSQQPMGDWFAKARALEQHPEILDISPYPMQPWLDVAEAGWSVVVTTADNPKLAEETAHEVAGWAWERREQ